MKSILFFLSLGFQMVFLITTPVLADSKVLGSQQQEAGIIAGEPIILVPAPENRGFFARLAERFRNLVNFFRGEGQKAQEKADQYSEKADIYASDAAKQPEQSWLKRILQGLADIYNRAASLWRKKADTDERRADLYQEQADHYERLAEEENTNKEKEMAKCFSDLLGAYEEKKEISLIAEGAEKVACDSVVFPDNFNIWWASLPQESDSNCFIMEPNVLTGRPPITKNYPEPPNGASISESAKQAKLDACRNKLHDVLEETMKSCWRKSQGVLLGLERQRLLEAGVDANAIHCSGGLIPSYIWNTPVESRVSCWIGMGDVAYGERNSLPPPPTTSEKQGKLNECVRLFSENSNLLKKKGIGSVPTYVGECLRNKAQAVDNRLKDALRVHGVPGPYQCTSPENYSITYTGTTVVAHGVGGCQGSNFRINRVMTHTVECPFWEDIVVVEPIDESWDACVRRSMQEAKRALLQGRTAGTYTCSGRYGSNRGWNVSCSLQDGSGQFSTGYQPYPTVCNSLPKTAAIASDPSPRESAGLSSGSE